MLLMHTICLTSWKRDWNVKCRHNRFLNNRLDIVEKIISSLIIKDIVIEVVKMKQKNKTRKDDQRALVNVGNLSKLT